MINLSLSLTIIWMLFVIIPSCVFSVDERHSLCTPSFSCGNLTDLYYPFWTPDREECGHPDFKVNCSGDLPEFSISSVKFQILEMNYYDQIIRLARMDYQNNLCSQHPEKATFDGHVLTFSMDTELVTFFYDCSGPKVDFLPSPYITQLECGANTGEQSYFVRRELPSSHDWVRDISDKLRASCDRNIDIPVSRSALKMAERNQTLDAIKKSLDEGFRVTFNNDCSECRRSGGACGHSQGSKGFICYCINEPHKHAYLWKDGTLQKSENSHWIRLWILGCHSFHRMVDLFHDQKTRNFTSSNSKTP